MRFAAALGAGALLAGCISTSQDVPAGYDSSAEARGYPTLESVPTTHTANTDQRYWERQARELMTARAAMEHDPRAQWGPPEDPAAFVSEARAVLEATRAAHE